MPVCVAAVVTRLTAPFAIPPTLPDFAAHRPVVDDSSFRPSTTRIHPRMPAISPPPMTRPPSPYPGPRVAARCSASDGCQRRCCFDTAFVVPRLLYQPQRPISELDRAGSMHVEWHASHGSTQGFLPPFHGRPLNILLGP